MPQDSQNTKGAKAVTFLKDILYGVLIGIAFIIPGFSGGSVAAILGVYERLVDAIADLFRSFRTSFLILFPTLIGMLVGILALLFPLKWALSRFPIPTVSLFVGLAIGGLPSVTKNTKGKPSKVELLCCSLAFLVALLLSFLPVSGEVDLFSLNVGGYFLLVLVGIVGSCALVIPGISGSMLLLILGYYNPIVSLFVDYFLKGNSIGTCILVLLCLAIGILIGFFAISVVMKICLKKYPRQTYFAILGFILGSIPTVFIATAKDAGMTPATLPASPLYWIAAVLLLAVGIAISLFFVRLSRKIVKDREQPSQE